MTCYCLELQFLHSLCRMYNSCNGELTVINKYITTINNMCNKSIVLLTNENNNLETFINSIENSNLTDTDKDKINIMIK